MMASGARRSGIGVPLPRVEDRRFVTGHGRYVDDLLPPNVAFAAFLRSPHAHAAIVSIDCAAALAAPGVIAIYTGADTAAAGMGTFPARFHLPPPAKQQFVPVYAPLVGDRARYVGDRVALVVADTKANARGALELIEVEYDVLPSVVTADAALQPDAPAVWDASGNLCYAIDRGDRAATDAAFAAAAHVVSADSRYPRIAASSLEPRAAIGDYDAWNDRFTLHASTQQPHRMKEIYAGVLGVPEDRVHVIAPDVGGGFGMKGAPYGEDAMVLWAARELGRPVKWTSDRGEALLADNQGRDHVDHGALAVDADGHILGLRVTSLVNLGAYVTPSSSIPGINVANLAAGYRVPAMDIAVRGVVTNTTQVSPYRGTGRPEATLLLERLIDKAARAAGLTPDEMRRRNLIPAAEIPGRTPGGTPIDSGDFHRVLERALALADWNGFAARKAESARAEKLRGIGMAYFAILAGSAVQSERMDIRVDRDGSLVVHSGTMASGQGHETVYAQMLADWLCVPFDRIRVTQGDTDRVQFGRGTFAARSMMTGGTALRAAADAVLKRATRYAAHMLETDADLVTFDAGVFQARGTNKTVTFNDVARQSYAFAGNPPDLGVGLDGSGGYVAQPTIPNGCIVVEVEVDPATGLVQILGCTSVDDCGTIINPLTAGGQIHGAIGQAFGEALMEEVRYDADSGQPLSGSFMDYGMPRADTVPAIVNEFIEFPTPSNPLGVKGASEGGSSGAPPAVVNAVLDALAPLGVTDLEVPLTPQRVWQAIQAAKARA